MLLRAFSCYKKSSEKILCEHLKYLSDTRPRKTKESTSMTNNALVFNQINEFQTMWLKCKCFWHLIVGWVSEWLRKLWDLQKRFVYQVITEEFQTQKSCDKLDLHIDPFSGTKQRYNAAPTIIQQQPVIAWLFSVISVKI